MKFYVFTPGTSSAQPLLSDTALQEQLTLKHLAFTDLALDNSDPFIVAIV